MGTPRGAGARFTSTCSVESGLIPHPRTDTSSFNTSSRYRSCNSSFASPSIAGRRAFTAPIVSSGATSISKRSPFALLISIHILLMGASGPMWTRSTLIVSPSPI
jgi:hypothetical protein